MRSFKSEGIISFVFILALLLISIKIYDDHKDNKLNDRTQIVEAQIMPVEQPLATEPVISTQSVPTALPEPPAEPVAQEYTLPDDQAKAFIYQKESNNCPTRWQGEYGACPAYHGTPTDPNIGYGICQATPAWKMASAGEDWATNYETQDRWCTQYANSRYGGWQNAYNEWVRKRWW